MSSTSPFTCSGDMKRGVPFNWPFCVRLLFVSETLPPDDDAPESTRGTAGLRRPGTCVLLDVSIFFTSPQSMIVTSP